MNFLNGPDGFGLISALLGLQGQIDEQTVTVHCLIQHSEV